jgi:hypothetical protein
MSNRTKTKPLQKRRKGAPAAERVRAVVVPQNASLEVLEALETSPQRALVVVVRDRAAVAPQTLQDASIEDLKATKAKTRERIWAMLMVVFMALVEKLVEHALTK